MIQVTPEKALREKAVFAAFIYDVVLLPLALVVALKSGSLTMLAEVMRGIFLVSVAILSWVTLRRIHRQQTGGYDFGLGKMSRCCPSWWRLRSAFRLRLSGTSPSAARLSFRTKSAS